MSNFAVLGGGISGLATAWRLHARGADVTLFEASDRTGGVIRSVERDGFLVDEGPNTLVARHAVVGDTVEALGLQEEQVWADPDAAKRYVVRDGVPVALPASPPALLTSSLLSARGKLRLLREPFVRATTDDDETVAAFIRRRLGGEVLDYAVDPFVGGILAGDPERLSTRYAFPPLWGFEQDHGSLFQGLRRAKNTAAPAPSSLPFSFRDGMQTLPDALTRTLGDAVRTGTRAHSLARTAQGWTVGTERDAVAETALFDGVVSTLPLHRFAALDFDAGLDLAPLAHTAHTDLTVLALGFRRDQVAHALDGFGMLIPSREPFNLLGVLFSSSLFSGRAPEKYVLLTCFIGGRRNPARASLPEADLVELALRDIRPLLGVRDAPSFVHTARWTNVIPQAEIGYGRVLDTLDALEKQHAGLSFAGSYRYGVSVGDALRSGLDAADRLVD